MMRLEPPTRSEISVYLDYDPETGVFIWKTRSKLHFVNARAWSTWNARFAGKVAGNQCAGRYRNICLGYRTFQAHRLAWLIVHGEWPVHIDHINGDKGDNRIANLRSVSNAENRKNQATRKDNTSGVQGVYWDRRNQKWMAKIQVEGKTVNLGRYSSIEEAAIRRTQAEREFGFHSNHGRTR